jgi:hypothetical protein
MSVRSLIDLIDHCSQQKDFTPLALQGAAAEARSQPLCRERTCLQLATGLQAV